MNWLWTPKSYDCLGSLIEKWVFIFYYAISSEPSSLWVIMNVMPTWASLHCEWLACETVANSYCSCQERGGRTLFCFWYHNFTNFINFLLTSLAIVPVSKFKSAIHLLFLYSLYSGELQLGLPLPCHSQLLFIWNHQSLRLQIKLFPCCMRYKELKLTSFFVLFLFCFINLKLYLYRQMGRTYETLTWTDLATKEKKIFLVSKKVPKKSDWFDVYNGS